MIAYSSTKKDFITDVLDGFIDIKILESMVRETGISVGNSEQDSIRNSMQFMRNVVDSPSIPDDCGIAIEYKIPLTSNRIDFILTGKNKENRPAAVIIELKQWSRGVHLTDKDGILSTDFFGDVNHPSYQAWSYTTLLEDYNSAIEDKSISLTPCAYLHNYELDNVVANNFYKEHIDKAPLFLKHDRIKLQSFINEHVKKGDRGMTMYIIERGEIRPSKSLTDCLVSMLEGNREFILIDDQKIVYEVALDLAEKSSSAHKNVLIIEGGPGTGKSVVAINLLAELNKRGKNTFYVTRNSAPRRVYEIMLSGQYTRTRISHLLSSSGSFHTTEPNTFDSLIVDEAHRLNAKSGLFSHLGENQIKEIINATKFAVFFIDEDQRVTLKDIGSKATIKEWAKKLGANIHNLELASQFRCNGSDGYLAWLDNILQIRQTANDSLEDIDYDFRVMDSPSLVHQEIICRNNTNNKSRIVAGYCWKWISKRNPELKDIVIDDYSATWNLNSHGQAWIVHPESVKEVGCIHTCQGLELEYVGVIIGPDMVIRDGEIITDASKRASTDQSVRGLRAIIKENEAKAYLIADKLIKNTYRTLMTRGMKGCFIYSTDPETQEYFRDHSKSNITSDISYGDNSNKY